MSGGSGAEAPEQLPGLLLAALTLTLALSRSDRRRSGINTSGKKAFRFQSVLETTSMFPAVRGLLDYPGRLLNHSAPGEAAPPGSDRCCRRVLCALGRVERTSFLSTSVLLHLETTTGPREAPRPPQH